VSQSAAPSLQHKLVGVMCGDKTGKKKDVSFLWTLYHKAMAVKLLRTQVGSEIEDNCIMCDLTTPEAPMHSFYECPRA